MKPYPLDADKVQVVEWDLERVVYELVYLIEGHSPAAVPRCCLLCRRPAACHHQWSLSHPAYSITQRALLTNLYSILLKISSISTQTIVHILVHILDLEGCVSCPHAKNMKHRGIHRIRW